MPIFDFRCAKCGAVRRNEYFRNHASVIDEMPCECGGELRRSSVHRVRVIGPVWEGMERYESALLSPKERAAGVRFHGPADIERYERDRGMSRVSEGSVEDRRGADRQMDEARTLERIRDESGPQAAVDEITRQDVTDQTGWTDARYNKWKGDTDAYSTAHPAGQDP